jgi:hypothetical protein
MTRFFKVFLRDQLSGRALVAGFGKHPAWDDHIDDIGLETETLVLTKQILYSQGIASQLASGAWDRIEASGQSIKFDHRFIWARGEQALVGTISASVDGKGRERFPLVICVQSQMGALQAIRLSLPFAEKLALRCRAAESRKMFRELLNQSHAELNTFPAFPSADAIAAHPEFEDDNSILETLDHLSEALEHRKPSSFDGGDQNRICLRLPAISLAPLENLEFWTGYLERRVRLQAACLVIATSGKLPVDLIIGEPASNDFFCLRAKESVLPITPIEVHPRRAAHFEPGARDYIESYRHGTNPDAGRRRSWWLSLFIKSH